MTRSERLRPATWDTVFHAERQTEEAGQKDMGQKDSPEGAPGWVREELLSRAADPQDMGQPLLSKGQKDIAAGSSELAAFMAVVQDRPKDAKDIVSLMSRRDRALLSFYLRELGSIVDTQDMRDSF